MHDQTVLLDRIEAAIADIHGLTATQRATLRQICTDALRGQPLRLPASLNEADRQRLRRYVTEANYAIRVQGQTYDPKQSPFPLNPPYRDGAGNNWGSKIKLSIK